MSDATIRPLSEVDWPEVQVIFAEGIATGHATFEAEPPSWDGFDSGKVTHSRFVATDAEGVVLGWVAASPVSSRSVYAGVVEHSVYVADAARGKGIGRALLKTFIESAERNGVWTIQSSIFPENAASIGLHAEFGFRSIGRRERIALMTYGPMAGQWRDTVLMERRSDVN
ncbi:MAG: N-acetyltransferase [Rhodoglobus sp.]|nr:N-acetyltransferase [Rhodoglobus sp.]